MADLKFENVNKIYDGGFHAVKDFNMEIEHGEFIVIVGPSGCGKSTMLRMIAGLEAISSGKMILNDVLVNKLAPVDRDIAMVFQNYALYGNMTVYENMGFSLTVRHASSDDIHEKVMEASNIVDMDKLLNRKPERLSGGQKQRVAIGRALVRDSSVFLMDEPLSNLDAKLRKTMRKELILLHDKIGATFIYVTHDQSEAMAMADRIVVMNDGIVQQIGSPKEIYDYPNNVFVSQFIGTPTMNLFEGVIKSNRFISSNFSFDLPGVATKDYSEHEDETVLLGIRPEDFHTTGIFSFSCEIVHFEYLGSEYFVMFKIEDDQIYQARIKYQEMKYGVGDKMELFIDMNRLHFFNKNSTQRIF